MATNLSNLLLETELGITIYQHWLSWLWILLGNDILPISVASLLLYFQPVTSTSLYRCGLSKRHAPLLQLARKYSLQYVPRFPVYILSFVSKAQPGEYLGRR